jgi:hypothetical protein
MTVTVEESILRMILEQPGAQREVLCRLFDLNDYRLNRVFRHIERNLAKRRLVHHRENGCWIIDVDPSRCAGVEWLGRERGGYEQCRLGRDFPDNCCFEHTRYENPEMVAFQRLISHLVGPAEPSSRSLSQLSLLQLEDLLATLQRIGPMSRRDQGTKRKLLSMMLAARATLRWKEEMRRRRLDERRIPPEFEERHRRSSINTYEYSLKKYFILLEVSESASRDDVLKAWRKMARRYHPDAEGGDEEMMKHVNLAKERIFRLRRWD